ncbi:hypothetical protein [Methylobacterium sp. JK268]
MHPAQARALNRARDCPVALRLRHKLRQKRHSGRIAMRTLGVGAVLAVAVLTYYTVTQLGA